MRTFESSFGAKRACLSSRGGEGNKPRFASEIPTESGMEDEKAMTI